MRPAFVEARRVEANKSIHDLTAHQRVVFPARRHLDAEFLAHEIRKRDRHLVHVASRIARMVGAPAGGVDSTLRPLGLLPLGEPRMERRAKEREARSCPDEAERRPRLRPDLAGAPRGRRRAQRYSAASR